jgi:hypothetical protein
MFHAELRTVERVSHRGCLGLPKKPALLIAVSHHDLVEVAIAPTLITGIGGIQEEATKYTW